MFSPIEFGEKAQKERTVESSTVRSPIVSADEMINRICRLVRHRADSSGSAMRGAGYVAAHLRSRHSLLHRIRRDGSTGQTRQNTGGKQCGSHAILSFRK